MAKFRYEINFDVQGDATAALSGLAARLSIGTGWDFGKARVMVSKLTRLSSGPKSKEDRLGLQRAAGMLDNYSPPDPKGWLVREEFTSLDIAIRGAVTKKLGKDYWVVDFSPSEVVLSLKDVAGYWKVSYKVVDGAVNFEGTLTPVKRVIDYI